MPSQFILFLPHAHLKDTCSYAGFAGTFSYFLGIVSLLRLNAVAIERYVRGANQSEKGVRDLWIYKSLTIFQGFLRFIEIYDIYGEFDKYIKIYKDFWNLLRDFSRLI